MKISKVAAATARRLFGLCQTNGKLGTVVTRLVESRPRDFRAILSALQRLIRLETERRKVTVESAIDLDDATRQRVASGLSTQYGDDLIIQYQVNPVLLGGLRIRVGSDVFDGSVQGRLDRLSRAF